MVVRRVRVVMVLHVRQEARPKTKNKKSHKPKKSKGVRFGLVRFCKCKKKFLDEAGTRTRDRWIPPKPINLYQKVFSQKGSFSFAFQITQKICPDRVFINQNYL